ncbi:MAG TPA: hypothetical protein VGM16_12225 [Gammaproteobacteria bacterium]|jgi:hypothetical protein
MVSLAQIWLPIVLGAVGVFIASSILHMALHKIWHGTDYHGFSNEDEVRAAIRKGSGKPGMYMLPWCPPEKMKEPATLAKFTEGPVGFLILRKSGSFNMGKSLGLWFVFCLLVSLFAGYLGSATLAAGTEASQVFRVTATAAVMGFALGSLPNHIWWGEPAGSTLKNLIDGIIYGCIVGALYAWLWPHAA